MPGQRRNGWLYTVLVDRRPEFEARMAERGIAVSQVHQRNDVYSVVAESRASLPGLDRVADRMVSIPVGWWVSDDDREHIAETIRGAGDGRSLRFCAPARRADRGPGDGLQPTPAVRPRGPVAGSVRACHRAPLRRRGPAPS
jgi:hypothetical protein